MTQHIAHVHPDELPRLEWEDGWVAGIDEPVPVPHLGRP